MKNTYVPPIFTHCAGIVRISGDLNNCLPKPYLLRITACPFFGNPNFHGAAHGPTKKRFSRRCPPRSAGNRAGNNRAPLRPGARSCVFPIHPIRWSRSFPRAPSVLIWRWAWAAFRAAGSPKFSGLNPPVKPPRPLHIIAEAQKRGGVAAFIDAEHALDINYARRLGLRPRICSFHSPTTASRPWEIADMLVRSSARGRGRG